MDRANRERASCPRAIRALGLVSVVKILTTLESLGVVVRFDPGRKTLSYQARGALSEVETRQLERAWSRLLAIYAGEGWSAVGVSARSADNPWSILEENR